jgi:hypothetical protein
VEAVVAVVALHRHLRLRHPQHPQQNLLRNSFSNSSARCWTRTPMWPTQTGHTAP